VSSSVGGVVKHVRIVGVRVVEFGTNYWCECVCVCCVVAEEGGTEHILQKSHRGFFAGMLMLSGGFVAIIMFYFSTAETSKAIIYLTTLITLHGIMLLATGVALFKIHQVRLSSCALCIRKHGRVTQNITEKKLNCRRETELEQVLPQCGV